MSRLYTDLLDAFDELSDIYKNKEAKDYIKSLKDGEKKKPSTLKESLETGISSMFIDLINQEYNLLTQYESAYVTMEDSGEDRFNEIMDYIEDDINIHIGMLQAAIEDLNPSAEKVDDGKDQAEEMILDESLFDAVNQSVETH